MASNRGDCHRSDDEEGQDGVIVSQSIIDACKEPLIGLQYLTEFQQKLNNAATVCVCNLCEVKFSFKLLVSHVTAMKHRIQYMKERFMNYHTMIYQLAKSNSEKAALSIEYAQCIEKEEGRQKVKVKVVDSTLENASSSSTKRPAEKLNAPHSLPSTKIRKVTDVRASVVTKGTSVMTEQVATRSARPQGPKHLGRPPILVSPGPARPWGPTSPLVATPREPLNNVRQLSPQPTAVRSALPLRTVAPGPRPWHSSSCQPISNKTLRGSFSNRINFVGRTVSTKDTNTDGPNTLHLKKKGNILTPSPKSLVENRETNPQPRSPPCFAQWSPSAVPRKSCLKSSAILPTSDSSLLSSASGPTVQSSPVMNMNSSIQPLSTDIMPESAQYVKLARCSPTSSHPEPPDVKMPALPPPSASPLPPPPPPPPPPLPPPLSPSPPPSDSNFTQLEQSPSSRSTLHLHPGFVKLLALIESPQKSSPAIESSVPNVSHTDPVQVPSGTRSQMPFTSRPVLPCATPSSCLRLSPRTLSAPRDESPPPSPYSSHPSSLPSRTLLISQGQSPTTPPPPPSFSSDRLPQTQPQVHPGLRSMRPVHTATFAYTQRPLPRLVGQAVSSRTSSSLAAFASSEVNHVIPQSNTNLATDSVRPGTASTIHQSNTNLATDSVRPGTASTIHQSNANPFCATEKPIIPQSIAFFSHCTALSSTEDFNARRIRALHCSSSDGTPRSSTRPLNNNSPADGNSKLVGSYRFQLPSSNKSQHLTQFPSVPGIRFIPPPPQIISGAHPVNRVCSPSYQVPSVRALQTPTGTVYSAGHQARLPSDTTGFVQEGKGIDGILNMAHPLPQHPETAATLLDKGNPLPVENHSQSELSHRKAKLPFEIVDSNNVFGVGSPPAKRPFLNAQPTISMPHGVPHTHSSISSSTHVQRPFQGPKPPARLPVFSACLQPGPLRNTEPPERLPEESTRETVTCRTVNAHQMPQRNATTRTCSEENLLDGVARKHTTNIISDQQLEPMRTNSAAATETPSVVPTILPSSVSSAVQHAQSGSSRPEDSLTNASAMSSALARALVEYRLKQRKNDKKTV